MPLRATDAKTLLRSLLSQGSIVLPGPGSHLRKEMAADGLSDIDIINVLRGGTVDEAEWENGGWRHHVRTAKICVIVGFEPEPTSSADLDAEEVIITAWKYNK